MNDGLFSMEEKREGNDGKAMVSFMVPAALKNELQERARRLHTTATRLMAEAIQLRLRKNDGANDMDRIGADEFVKGNAIRTLIAARLTDESPAQAWVIAYRAGWNDAVDFCTRMNRDRCVDISAQTYKPNCPPVALTKLPLITTETMAGRLVALFDSALAETAAQKGAAL